MVAFMAMTTLQTQKQEWKGHRKSSTIALLFHRLDQETIRSLGAVNDRSEMYESAAAV